MSLEWALFYGSTKQQESKSISDTWEQTTNITRRKWKCFKLKALFFVQLLFHRIRSWVYVHSLRMRICNERLHLKHCRCWNVFIGPDQNCLCFHGQKCQLRRLRVRQIKKKSKKRFRLRAISRQTLRWLPNKRERATTRTVWLVRDKWLRLAVENQNVTMPVCSVTVKT